jgi:hypothetical protein
MGLKPISTLSIPVEYINSLSPGQEFPPGI